MFANTGVFRDVTCPYFIHGLCVRPYCHFKHSKTEEAKERKKEEEALKAASKEQLDDSYTVPTSALQETLASIEESIKSEKQKLLDKDKVSKDVPVATSTTKTQPTGTPQYNPTPLHELGKQKTHGKQVGNSKYDLALLNDKKSASEYDPASNYSTHFGASTKSQDTSEEGHDHGSESDSVITDAKIPQFVSIDYTPATFGELSEEESFCEKQEASENESDKSFENKNKTSVEETSKAASKDCSDKSAPLEFNLDGTIKIVPYSTESLKSSSNHKENESPLKEAKKVTKEKVLKDGNIFSLFEDEFDQELEKCASSDVKSISRSCSKDSDHSNSKKRSTQEHLKTPGSSSKCRDSLHHVKSNGENPKLSSKHSSHHSDVKHSSHKHEKSNGENPKSSSKHSSHHSDIKHSSHKNDKSKSSSSTPGKHDKHQSHKKHSDLASVSKSKPVKSCEKDQKSERHRSNSLRHSESSSSSPSRKHSSHSLKNGEYRDKTDKTPNHKDKPHHSREREKHKSGEKTRKTSHSGEKKSGKHKSSSSKEKSASPKKRKITSLDVDLFGAGDSDSDVIDYRKGSGGKKDLDLDLDSDLEKYFSDEDPFDECLRIFNEQPVASTSGTGSQKKSKKKEEKEKESASIGKKRIALKQGDEGTKRRKVDAPSKPAPKPSPAQVMMNRYKMMQERVLQAEQESKDKIKAKVREMSKQNRAKLATQPTSTPNVAGATAAFSAYMKNKKTPAITASKGQKRKAHTPTVAIEKLKRPVVEISSSAKVGSNIRQRYLNMFIDECLKLYATDKEAFERGKEEEEAIYKRCLNKKIYLNLAVHTVKRLRNEIVEKKKKKNDPKGKGKVKGSGAMKMSHAQMLDGAHAKNTNFTVNRSGGAIKLQEEDFLGADLYKRLKPYILTEDQLRENNYPRSDPVTGGAAIFYGESRSRIKGKVKGYEKLCVRCGKVFEVYPNGKYPRKEECVYHWGKAWKRKIAGSLETRYTCCSGDLSSDGCQVAKAHVHETNKIENVSGYMKTIPSSPPIDGDYGVYALDCEMVYTTMGMELARVTVVGADAEPVYESLVKPDNNIVDFNTRFSGITEDDMEGVSTTLRGVQAVLLSLFTDKTILMGHSLESDLIALKLIHSTVVDTSLVFPHRMGLPYKRALRNLMSEILKKIIQDDVGGHDSLEDAVACLELMQYQLKEDARKEARRLST